MHTTYFLNRDFMNILFKTYEISLFGDIIMVEYGNQVFNRYYKNFFLCVRCYNFVPENVDEDVNIGRRCRCQCRMDGVLDLDQNMGEIRLFINHSPEELW